MNLSAIDKVTKGNVRTTGVSPFLELEIEKVYANPNQPRKQFDDLEDLAASIKINGLIQPIAVVSDGTGKYMIISGERRFRASLLNEARTIKSHIIKADSKQIKELALVENVQRSDLTDFEIAKYISILWDSGEYKKKSDLAAAIGKKPSFISKAFGCLKLDKEILQDLEESQNNVPLTVLEEISRLKDKDTQKEVYDKYVAGEIVRKDIQDFKPSKKEKRYEDEVFEAVENFPGEKETTYQEYKKQQQKEKEAFKNMPLSEKLPKIINKMIYIVRGQSGGSKIYAKMLLSMLPNYDYEVSINYWCYKSDSDDFQTMLELMQNYNSYKWEYEKLVKPYIEELKEFLGLDNE